jgi:hypothetical protein
MGQAKSTDTGFGLIEMFEERHDIKAKLRSSGIWGYNFVEGIKNANQKAQNKYLLNVDQNTVRFIFIAKLTAAKRAQLDPNPKGCNAFWEKDKAKVYRLSDLPIPFLESDQDMPVSDLEMIRKIAARLEALPMVESKKLFFDIAEEVQKTVTGIFGNSLPHHSVYWHHWDNCMTVKNLAFHGLGACKYIF